MTAVMTMSSFGECPRVGHLDRLHCMVSFLYQFRGAKLLYQTEKPDFPTTPDIPPLNWKYTLYGKPSEQLPLNAPQPLGESVQLTTFYNANLMHNMLSGRLVTGFLHFWNKTPMDWYSKKQKTTETVMYW